MIDYVQYSLGWMDNIIKYLEEGKLFTEKFEVKKIRRKDV